MEEKRFLIVGLGNPGKTYENTRHNIGFRIVKALAAKWGITLRPSLIRAKGGFGKKTIQDKEAHLLLPLTYMNESGLAVRKCLNYYKIPLDQLMVVTDDVAIPLGTLRLRIKGSCGGHKGLSSVEKHLGTTEYARLRVGVGDRSVGELADYVLGRFSLEEQTQLPAIVDQAIHGIELWLEKGAETAMQEVNT
ncbi:MAG: Peptidyl-tRNA hydrolase [Chlamydiae bacterium]|nr:Peptidyl-tRNA hydrolase [Chlamydiota bacterium]